MHSSALTVAAYLKSLPEDRRAVLSKLRGVIRKNLPSGYVETMRWGMISYEIPLKTFPETYNGQPLSYAGLASQKNNYALYLMGVYMDPAIGEKFRGGFKKAGKKLDMGKSCVRFKRAEDIDLPSVARAVSAMPVKKYIAQYKKSRRA